MAAHESTTLPFHPQTQSVDPSQPSGITIIEPQRRICENTPFAIAAPVWLKSREPFLQPASIRSYTELLRPLMSFFGQKPLVEIDGDLIRDYQNGRAQKAGGERINHEIGILKQMLQRARTWSRIADDVQRLPEQESDIGRVLTPDDQTRLFALAATRVEWAVAYWAALIAANTTACGRELKAMRIRDVNLDRKEIYIRFGKNRFRVRPIPLNSTALYAVKELLDRARGLGAVEPDHYLFPFRIGGNTYDPTRPVMSWKWAWRNFTRLAGLPGLRFHDMRHHAITELGENGTPETVLKAIAGHVTTAMMEHYSHPRMEAKRRAIETLDNGSRAAEDAVLIAPQIAPEKPPVPSSPAATAPKFQPPQVWTGMVPSLLWGNGLLLAQKPAGRGPGRKKIFPISEVKQ